MEYMSVCFNNCIFWIITKNTVCVCRSINHVLFLLSRKRYTVHAKAETNSKTENWSCYKNKRLMNTFFCRAHTHLLFTFQGIHQREQMHSDMWQKRMCCHPFLPFYSHLSQAWTIGSLSLKIKLYLQTRKFY